MAPNGSPFIEEEFLHWPIGETKEIAAREGREITMTLQGAGPLMIEDHLAPRGAHRFIVQLGEGDREGRAIFHIGPDFVSGGWIRTTEMLPGMGTIFMDYLTTLAQAMGRRRDFVAIQNPKIFHIIERSRLLIPEASTIEAYFPSATEPDSYDASGPIPFENHSQFRKEMAWASHFTVRGIPNPHR